MVNFKLCDVRDCLPQTLYAAMHEPDGVRGVNALRREEPSLQEQILEHESIGLLRDATACYDRAIQLESDQVPKHPVGATEYFSGVFKATLITFLLDSDTWLG